MVKNEISFLLLYSEIVRCVLGTITILSRPDELGVASSPNALRVNKRGDMTKLECHYDSSRHNSDV